MTIVNNINSLKKRRRLRQDKTLEEDLLWQMIRGNKTGFKWRRQVSIGGYIADFYCFEKKLVIELDGKHHLDEKSVEYDSIRDGLLKDSGVIVIRISNNEVRLQENIVYQKIINHLHS